MTHLQSELKSLKTNTIDMWKLVISQLEQSLIALKTFDNDLAREVISKEKQVNSYELKIDRDCENIFALFNPVAVDLRMVLATLKINSNLERIGDIAEGISKLITREKAPFDKPLMECSRFFIMFEEAIHMVRDVLIAFDKEDTKLARSIFKKDELLDEINAESHQFITAYIKDHLDKTEQALNVLSIIRKLERVGDQGKNIAEEIIFYLEAKILKHR